MFLNLLRDDEKNQFLCLAIKAAESNGKVESVETDMISAFAKEMNINPFYKTDKSVDQIIDSLNEMASIKEKQIIVFEMAGILLSDASYDKEEQAFYHDIVSGLNISESKADKYIKLINEYTDLYKTIYKDVLTSV